ncbi:MAG: hypothetical protein Crog4KO_06370 [Crocinitomicaceae bacterium]
MKAFGQIAKAVLFTILYIVVIELIGAWILAAEYFGVEFLIYDYFEIISSVFVLISVAIFSILVNRKFSLKPQNSHAWWYLIGAICGALFVFMQTPLNWGYDWIAGTNYDITYDFDGIPYLLSLYTIASILLIPIAEELFFRDFLQRSLQKHVHPIMAIGTCALLFGAIHLPYENLFLFEGRSFSFHHAYITFFGGTILGVIYYKSKSVGPTIVMHMFWNLFAIVL